MLNRAMEGEAQLEGGREVAEATVLDFPEAGRRNLSSLHDLLIEICLRLWREIFCLEPGNELTAASRGTA